MTRDAAALPEPPLPAPRVSVRCAAAAYVTVAFHQNAVPVIHEITIDNPTDRDLHDVVLTVAAEPAFTPGMTIRIERIAAQSSHHVRLPDLPLDVGFLRRLSEGLRGDIALTAKAGEEILAETTASLTLFPPSHWGGTRAAPELTAAFVRPNDPSIDVILHDASSRLARAGKDGAISGYAQGKRERVWDIAGAIWAALAARGLVYVLPPASFERTGQKVRSPSDILDRKTGTCFDLTLLFAACLEQAGLNPLVVLTEGHAFAGLWLREEEFAAVAVDDIQTLRKRRDLDDLLFVETTLLTHAQPPKFSAAVAAGAAQVGEGAVKPLDLAIDIRRARMMQIRPLDLGDEAGPVADAGEGRVVADLELDAAPSYAENIAIRDERAVVGRLERWKRKLLDLSLRNKLLNFKDGGKAIGFECPDPGRLEDLLADGTAFKLLPRTHVLGEGDQRDAQLFQERNSDDGRRRFVLDALEKKQIHTYCAEQDLENRLTELYRLARSAFEEGGANIMFLALGFLKWTPAPNSPDYRAPLLLVPVALERTSVRAGFRLKLHEDDARFNPTLLEMLRQDFELRMPTLEGDLPVDTSGLDVARIWRTVRESIVDLKGWEVTTEVVLSTFSFTKFLLWKDLVDRVDELKRNPIVRHLIDTPKESYGDGRPFPDPAEIDRDFHPRNVFAPLSSDSSQLSAVLAAGQGQDFVLFGPPGTGKSQTIANMIAHCLAHQKTVLFVAQKTTALEVVQRRLNDLGLGEYCLEVHSTKAQKSQVLGQLKSAWHERAAPGAEDWQGATSELAALRDELNGLVSALHRRRPSGLTAHTAFGTVVAARGRYADLRFAWATAEHPQASRDTLRELCRELHTMLPVVGDPAYHPLKGIGAADWTPQWQRDLGTALDALGPALDAVRRTAAPAAAWFGIDVPQKRSALKALAGLAGEVQSLETSGVEHLLTGDETAPARALDTLAALQARVAQARQALAADYSAAIFGQNLRRILAEWTEASGSNFLVRGGKQRRVRSLLVPFAKGAVPDDVGRDLVRLIEIADIMHEAEALQGPLAVFGSLWQGLGTDAELCRVQLASATGLRRRIAEMAPTLSLAPADLAARIVRSGAGDRRPLGAFCRSFVDAHALLAKVTQLAAGSPILGDRDSWIEDGVATLQRWRASLNKSQAWTQWAKLSRRAADAGLGALTGAIEIGLVPAAEIVDAFDVAYARGWAEDVVTHDPVLRTFISARHEAVIERYRAADDRVRELTKRVIRASLAGGVPAPTAFGSDPEWGTLARELAKKARHLPLRQLFSHIPSALTRLTPCVMMSPLSIAQFMPPSSPPFDLVIFDEASQIPVWDAIGAMARGRQVVIVGDPEQLPPTNVGERGVDDIEDGTDVEDQESILDECLASNIRPLRLNWHYRSRFESLIAFSNQEYYKGRLVTFPSPVTDDRAVHYVHVPGGIYERGKGRVNRVEAAAVVADVVRRLREPVFTHARLSLGIVTFNGDQQRLIENLLDQERRANPDLELFFDPKRWHEPVIVRNLENVQGDERDIILFSVTFAQVDPARPVTTISSLNKAGGHRRLNVAITRARQEMAVFATLRSDQIQVDGKGSRGVRDFKHFLEFAERGPRAMAEAFAATGEDTESPFEDAVKAALEQRQWEVHPQIGVSGFRVDLGIVYPDAPGRYLAGVECDGASYHRSATARDRDRLRETVLTQLGWRIRRVWSTDWWMDADAALDTLHGQLEQLLADDRRAVAEAEAAAEMEAARATAAPAASEAFPGEETAGDGEVDLRPDIAPSLPDEPLQGVPDSIEAAVPARRYADAAAPAVPDAPDMDETGAVYQLADLRQHGFALDAATFYTPGYRDELARIAAFVIAQEAPIFDDVLVQRIARAHDFGRAAGRIRETIMSAVGDAWPRTVEGDRTVIWAAGGEPPAISPYRAAADGVRGYDDIPLAELADLARSHLDLAEDEEVIRAMARSLGLGRLRDAARTRLTAAIAHARSAAEAAAENGESSRDGDPQRGGGPSQSSAE